MSHNGLKRQTFDSIALDKHINKMQKANNFEKESIAMSKDRCSSQVTPRESIEQPFLASFNRRHATCALPLLATQHRARSTPVTPFPLPCLAQSEVASTVQLQR